MKRQIPGKIAESEFLGKIEFLAGFLGDKWISKNTNYNSPLKILWNRRDFLASTELYIVASALQNFLRDPANEKWMSNYKTFLKSAKATEVFSQSYELISASFFNTHGQGVKLCEPTMPGYDYTINTHHKLLRVSCKKLQRSDIETKFRTLASQTFKSLLNYLESIRVTGVGIVVFKEDGDAFPSFANLDRAVKASMKEFLRLREPVTTRISGLIVSVKPMSVDIPGWILGERNISLQFNCLFPIPKEEQKRFENLFRQAATNLKNKAQPLSPGEANVVMIGLPASISIPTAESWLKGQFTSTYSSISAVVLTRYLPVQSVNQSESMTGFEYKVISNPNSSQMWPDPEKDKLVGSIPLGMPLEDEPRQLLMSNLGGIDVTNFYAFQRGQIYHEHVSGPLEYTFKAMPGVRIFSTLRPIPGQESIMLEAIRPPEDEFVIL